ncbi:MAG: phosphonoacetate hydrolase [Candidatus Thioglobus autotrophicus]|nr:phosphonoacetate hydrolase [Candidatus Thioglobus autotrophicus]
MIKVNNNKYTSDKANPVVIICMDGTSFDYYEGAREVMPNLWRMIETGTMGIVDSVIPSFTNPNNMAMVTGVSPAENGICGNFYYDQDLDDEVMMNEPRYLCADSILASFSQNGKKVAIVTSKDKLRKMLSHNLNGICFSVEFADQVTLENNGIVNVTDDLMHKVNPGIYDPDNSVYLIEAGVRLLEKEHFDLMYLTSTDYVQHKNAPGSEGANSFLAGIDHWIGELDKLGAVVAVTADHGMQSKTNAQGQPNVRFLEDILISEGIQTARVILPITDPYVVHHGALGSYATIYIDDSELKKASTILKQLDGVEDVLTKEQAAERFELPKDRIGDLVITGDKHTVLGHAADRHDLESVQQGLRSHGGMHEARVPIIINRQLKSEYKQRLESGNAKNREVFDFAINGTED